MSVTTSGAAPAGTSGITAGIRPSAGSAMPYAAAAGAVLGSWVLSPVPPAAAAAVAAVCLWRPRPVLVLALLVALTGFLGNRALAGLADPPSGPVEGWVTLLDDPRPLGTLGARVTVRHEGMRVEVRAHGAVSARLDDVLAGERVRISGRFRPSDDDWHRWRHVVGTITAEAVHEQAPAAPLAGFANRVRRLLASGAQSLSDDDRSLFTGMIYGDDRNQSARLSDDFRAAGLGHLLVVSGQNVAFVLALAAPLAVRLRPGVRLVALLGVLGVFAVLTRFEPSVLRAVAMAAVAVGSAALGRPEVGRRTLAWAVAGVLVLDPFLVRSLAFQLSVCATAGLLWITPALTDAMPGPRPLRLAVATTAGAQLAVTPLLIAVFGSVPVASLPANVIAGPASAPVMMWGLTGGLGAGVAGGWWAWLVHRPTAALLWWVRTVAEAAAAAPPAMLGPGGAAAVGVGVALVLTARRLRSAETDSGAGMSARGPRVLGLVGGCAVAAALAHSVLGAASPPAGWSEVPGARILRHDDVTVVELDRPRSPERLLGSLRMAGVRRVDLIVASRGGAADAHAVLALTDRYRAANVVAPPMHRVPGARTVRAGTVVRLGSVAVEVVADDPDLVVVLTGAGASSPRVGATAAGDPVP